VRGVNAADTVNPACLVISRLRQICAVAEKQSTNADTLMTVSSEFTSGGIDSFLNVGSGIGENRTISGDCSMLTFEALALDLIDLGTSLDDRGRPPVIVLIRCIATEMTATGNKSAFWFIDKSVHRSDFTTLLSEKWEYMLGSKPRGGFRDWLRRVLDMFGTEIAIQICTDDNKFTVIR